MSDFVIPAILFVCGAVFLIVIVLTSVAERKGALRECLAHQQWCVEHYQLEEVK